MWSITRAPGGATRGVGGAAMFVRVADAIADDIRRGVLRAGDRLPSSRELARRFDVNRNTIVAAYDELTLQGWAVARGPAGTFVTDAMPERPVRRAAPARGMAARPSFELAAVPAVSRAPLGPPEARYQLSMGVPDPRLFPSAVFARAFRRALRGHGARAALEYGEPSGTPRLRTALAAMLRATRGLPIGPENVMVTRGSQMGLDLAARLLVRPGACVAVEELGYAPAWRALERAGARLIAAPLDAAGLQVEAVDAAAPIAVYTTPHHQYPTTVTLTPARRLALLTLARRRTMAILEDDYDHEFHFEGRPVAPLAASDRGDHVIYLGTLSKILAPGLRLGFVVAAERVIEQLARLRASIDRQGDHVIENAVADMIEDGELQRHARKMRRCYQARRDALVTALARELGGALTFELPAGGMTLWAQADDVIRIEGWRRAALDHGVAFTTARDLHLEARATPFLRLGFARHDEVELTDAVRRLRRALDAPGVSDAGSRRPRTRTRRADRGTASGPPVQGRSSGRRRRRAGPGCARRCRRGRRRRTAWARPPRRGASRGPRAR